MVGYHFHNNSKTNRDLVEYEGKQFIESTFCKALENGTVQLPDGPNGEMVEVPISSLGISHPVVVTKERIEDVRYLADSSKSSGGRVVNPGYTPRGPRGGGGEAAEVAPPKTLNLRQYNFVIQFCWQQKPREKRRAEWAQQGGTMPETASFESSGATNPSDRS